MVPKRALDEVLILYKSNKLLLNLFSFQALNLSAILCSWGCLPQITKGQHSGGQLQLSVDSLLSHDHWLPKLQKVSSGKLQLSVLEKTLFASSVSPVSPHEASFLVHAAYIPTYSSLFFLIMSEEH